MSQDKFLIMSKDGYPAQVETFETLNDATQQALTNIAAVCGSNTILKGCEDDVRNGITYVTDGILCIGGKIYQFKGGVKSNGVTIITDKVDDIYDTGDGSAKQMLPVRGFSYVTNSPIGNGSMPWASFVRVSDLVTITNIVNDLKPKVDALYPNRVIGKEKKTTKSLSAGGNIGFWIVCDENVEGVDVIAITGIDVSKGSLIRHSSNITQKNGKNCWVEIYFTGNQPSDVIVSNTIIMKV